MTDSIVSVRLPAELGDQLTALSEMTQRPKAVYVREALEKHLDDIADYYLAAEIARAVATGEVAEESWGALRAEYDLAGEKPDPDLLDSVQ